jgi:hypothetical protein
MMRSKGWLRDAFNTESRLNYAWMRQALGITLDLI